LFECVDEVMVIYLRIPEAHFNKCVLAFSGARLSMWHTWTFAVAFFVFAYSLYPIFAQQTCVLQFPKLMAISRIHNGIQFVVNIHSV
jgi:hypothetical protein